MHLFIISANVFSYKLPNSTVFEDESDSLNLCRSRDTLNILYNNMNIPRTKLAVDSVKYNRVYFFDMLIFATKLGK